MNNFDEQQKFRESSQQATAQTDSDSDYDDICSVTNVNTVTLMSQPGSTGAENQFVPCPNGCSKIFGTKPLESHMKDTCPNKIVDCDFSKIGCNVRLPRKDMPLHMEQAIIDHHTKQLNCYEERLKLLEEENKVLSTRCARLEAQQEELIQKVSDTFDKISAKLVNTEEDCKDNSDYENMEDPFKIAGDDGSSYVSVANLPLSSNYFIMTNFQIHKKSNDYWVSQPFYTHSQGYKMCLKVTANGQGSGKGTHVAVAVYLMKGEFDDQLEWPFRGNITIQLLNQQTRSGEDYTRTIYQAKGEKSKACSTEKFICAWGVSKFKSHSELFPKYVQNDSLKFHISTLVKSKPTSQMAETMV